MKNILFGIALCVYTIPCYPSSLLSIAAYRDYCSTKIPQHEKLQEGFRAGTVVKTPYGYTAIENLKPGDCIINYDLDGNYQEQSIRAISKHIVSDYVNIFVDNEIIGLGLDQRLYVAHDNYCLPAHKIALSHLLVRNSTDLFSMRGIEIIHEETELYAITVADHNFLITPYDIQVHNADMLIAYSADVIVGSVAITNPIIAILGAATALYTLAYLAYEHTDANPTPDQSLLLQERTYYEQRKRALIDLRQQFVTVKNDLVAATSLPHLAQTSFSSPFLQAITYQLSTSFLQPSVAQELKLCPKERDELCTRREMELGNLEQDILNLQITIAFHFNELLEQLDAAYSDYENVIDQINSAIDLWNTSLNRMTIAIAILNHEKDLLEYYLVENIAAKVQEIALVIKYYNTSPKALIIKNTTSISELLEELQTVVKNDECWINEQKTRINKNFALVGQYLSKQGVNLVSYRNKEQEKAERQQVAKKTKQLAEAQKRHAAILYPKPPKKDDDEKKKQEEKEKHPHGKYEDASYHHRGSSGDKSPAPKNGQRALDNSIEIKLSRHRIGVSDGEIVMLKKTSNDTYHGYVVTWEEMTSASHLDAVAKQLIDEGLVTKSGKIIG